jgi:PAS domain S-box-containing protein
MDKKHLKLMLIDGDGDDFLLVKRLLSDVRFATFHLDWAQTYEDGLEAMCRSDHDAYLLDFRMGEHNGLEMISEAVARGCDAAIIMLTPQGNHEVDSEAMHAGAADYLVKDLLSKEHLERSLRYSMDRKYMERDLRRALDELEISVRKRTADLEAANRALEMSEERHRALIENAPDIIYTIRADGTILGLNTAFETITGWLAGDWVGKEIQPLIHPDDFPSFFDGLNRLIRGESVPAEEVRILCESGEYRILECKSVPPMKDGQIVAIMGTARDVTERKLMQEALRKAYDEMELRVKERIAELDVANEALAAEINEKGRVEEALRLDEMRLEALWELSRMSGSSDEEIANFVLDQQIRITGSKVGVIGILKDDETSFTIHSSPGYEECAIQQFFSTVVEADIRANVVSRQRPRIIPIIINHYQSSRPVTKNSLQYVPLNRVISIPVLDGEQIVAVVTLANKETDYDESNTKQVSLLLDGMWRLIRRQRAEKALRNAKNSLRLMADSLPSPIAYVDTNCRYRFVNRAYEYRYGIPAGRVPGLRMEEFLSPYDYELVRPHVETALKGQYVQFEMKTSYDANSFLSVCYVPDLNQAGEVAGFFALINDLTEKKQSDMKAQRFRDKLAHVARVAAMPVLMSPLVHDMVQPLTAIRTNAQVALRFLAMDAPNLEEVQTTLADIIQDNQRASDVIRRLRHLLQGEHVAGSELDINAAVQASINLLVEEAASNNVTIETRLAPDLPQVAGDSIQFQQVLLNLILDGFDAMTTVESTSRKIVIQTSRDEANNIRVAVSDRRPVVDPEIMEHISESFFPSTPASMGMGLPVSRSLIEARGGQIRAEKNLEGGVTISLSLPIEASTPPDQTPL